METRAKMFSVFGLRSKAATQLIFEQFAEIAQKFPVSHVTEAAAMLLLNGITMNTMTQEQANEKIDAMCRDLKERAAKSYKSSGDRKTLIVP